MLLKLSRDGDSYVPISVSLVQDVTVEIGLKDHL